MLFLKGCVFLCFLVGIMAEEESADSKDSDITKFMKHLQVIPDVIDNGPRDFLKVSYDSGVVADKGVELTPTQVRNQPKVEWTAEDDAEYTLIMTDPDAPSRANPKEREFQHWIVGNIPGNEVSKGEVLSAYIGSAPPEGTDLHRYVFLVFKQPSKKITFSEPRLPNTSASDRTKFNTRNLIDKYQLGIPVAGNFYQAKFDSSVPETLKQLGIAV